MFGHATACISWQTIIINNSHRYPAPWIFAVWEELNWRWWEELKEMANSMFREMQSTHPTREELKFYALAPCQSGGPRFELPTAFQLDAPGGYYMTVVQPRQERIYERRVWNIVHSPTGTLPPAARNPPREGGTGPGDGC